MTKQGMHVWGKHVLEYKIFGSVTDKFNVIIIIVKYIKRMRGTL